MANIYVSADRGNDSTGDGSAANPYATLNKPLGSSGVAAAGDAVYVEPGIYRETIAFGAGGSSGSPITIVGDGDGAGFAAGGYATPKTGLVEIAAWTDDFTPFATTAVILSANNKSFITIRGFKVTGGAGTNGYSCFELYGGSTDWTIEDCIFFGSTGRGVVGRLEASTAAALNITVRRCRFVSTANSATYYGVDVRSPLSASEYDLSVLFQNCRFIGGAAGVRFVQVGGTGTAWSTGTRIQQCGFWWGARGIFVQSTPALTTPIGVYGCYFSYGNAALSAATAGQIVEDGNAFVSPNPYSNVTGGANSKTSVRPAWSLGDEELFGGAPRPYFEPTAGSPLLGAGNYGTPPSVDILNRARPDGGAVLPAIGDVERHDVGTKDATHQDSGSPACLKLTGKSTYRRPVLVKAGAARTIAVKVRWDGNHGDGSKPQAALLAEPQLGFAGEVETATSTGGTGSTPNAYETLTFTAFTPTTDGVVMIEFRSRAAASNGAAYFDTISVA